MREFWKKPENWLAIIAIVFAVTQFIDARIQERRISEVAREMSTRFIGLFPKNMNEITDVVEKTTKHLDIIVDFAGYGHYSNPEAFYSYRNALLSKAQNSEVRMILYSQVPAHASTSSQFALDDQAKWNAERISARFLKFFGEVHRGRDLPKNSNEFNAALQEYQAQYRKDLCDGGVQIRTVDQKLLFFLWLEDNEEAALSFQDKATGAERELSIRTLDANLIQAMHDIFKEMWKEAKPLEGCHSEDYPK
ncbi:MAG TPA: hypothetical protein VI685_23540 [Candidatus Angelobacter sp.]